MFGSFYSAAVIYSWSWVFVCLCLWVDLFSCVFVLFCVFCLGFFTDFFFFGTKTSFYLSLKLSVYFLCYHHLFLYFGGLTKFYIYRDVLITCSPHWKKLQLARAWYLPHTSFNLRKKEVKSSWGSWVKPLRMKSVTKLPVLQGINCFSYFPSSSCCRLSVSVKCCSWPRVWEIFCFWRIFLWELQLLVLVLWQHVIRKF